MTNRTRWAWALGILGALFSSAAFFLIGLGLWSDNKTADKLYSTAGLLFVVSLLLGIAAIGFGAPKEGK